MSMISSVTLSMKSRRALCIGILAAASIAGALIASAQTCRVAMGVNSDGRKAYMEVYEYDYVPEKPTFPGGDWRLVERGPGESQQGGDKDPRRDARLASGKHRRTGGAGKGHLEHPFQKIGFLPTLIPLSLAE